MPQVSGDVEGLPDLSATRREQAPHQRLHAFEGAWMDHPFWRTRFVVTDPADIQKAQAGGKRPANPS